jgi:hypothetical protein
MPQASRNETIKDAHIDVPHLYPFLSFGFIGIVATEGIEYEEEVVTFGKPVDSVLK